jgi:antitoxin MazE
VPFGYGRRRRAAGTWIVFWYCHAAFDLIRFKFPLRPAAARPPGVDRPTPADAAPVTPVQAEPASACATIVLTLQGKPMEVAIRKMGNSQGVLIPKPILAQVGLEGSADLQVRDGVIEIRPVRRNPREGWDKDARRLTAEGGDGLVWPELANEGDDELVW